MPSFKSVALNARLRWQAATRLTPDTAVIALRQQLDKRAEKTRVKGVEITPVTAGPVKGEWLTPENADRHRVILYFHGGGYCIGSAATVRPLVAQLAKAARARALSLNYRLAPEHPYPAAKDDALLAYRWLLGQGINPRGMILAGNEAGGGLAIAAAMALRDGGAPVPGAIVCLSPWTDLTMSGWSIIKNARSDVIVDFETLSVCARHYLKDTNPTNPLASPLWGDFKGLPPILVHVGRNEILLDDATRLSDRTDIAQTNCSVEVFDDMPHVFQSIRYLKETAGSLSRIGGFMISRTSPVSQAERIAPRSEDTKGVESSPQIATQQY